MDHSVLAPFSLTGLGLVRAKQRRERNTPLPTLFGVALDLTDPHAVTITYRVHVDDVDLPLAHGVFTDQHPPGWIAALASQDHVLLTVADCAALATASTPEAISHALDNSWTALISCTEDCVGRSTPTHPLPCHRHSYPSVQTPATDTAGAA